MLFDMVFVANVRRTIKPLLRGWAVEPGEPQSPQGWAGEPGEPQSSWGWAGEPGGPQSPQGWAG